MDNREKLQEIINNHAIKAQNSSYDRDTCILAILKSREALMTIPNSVKDDDMPSHAIPKLQRLFEHYNDLEGEYTSGRGVIGALIDDIKTTFYD